MSSSKIEIGIEIQEKMRHEDTKNTKEVAKE